VLKLNTVTFVLEAFCPETCRWSCCRDTHTEQRVVKGRT